MTFGARSSDESKPKQFLWAHEDAMISFVGRMEDHGNCLFYLVLFSYSLENNKKIFQGIYHIQILSNPQGQIIPMIRKGNTTFLKVTMALLNKCPRHYIDIGGDKPRLTGRNIENFALKNHRTWGQGSSGQPRRSMGSRERTAPKEKRKACSNMLQVRVLKAVHGSILLAQRTRAFNKI